MSDNRPYMQPPSDLDLPLWRYLSSEKFESLIETSSIYFCRADRFPDELEGSYGIANNDPRYNSLYAPKSLDPVLIQHMRNQMRRTISSMRMETFISCWHVNYSESAKMWKGYCNDGKGKLSSEGICITTTYRKLREEIKAFNSGIAIGFVNYIDHNNTFIPEYDSLAPFYCKSKKQFVHEQELRLLWEFPNRKGTWKIGENSPLGVLVRVNLPNLIEAVIPSPKASNDQHARVRNI